METGLIAFWIVCGFAGWLIGGNKGQALSGSLLGLLLGPLGVIVIAVMKPSPMIEARRQLEVEEAAKLLRSGTAPTSLPIGRRLCPSCGGEIRAQTRACELCGVAIPDGT